MKGSAVTCMLLPFVHNLPLLVSRLGHSDRPLDLLRLDHRVLRSHKQRAVVSERKAEDTPQSALRKRSERQRKGRRLHTHALLHFSLPCVHLGGQRQCRHQLDIVLVILVAVAAAVIPIAATATAAVPATPVAATRLVQGLDVKFHIPGDHHHLAHGTHHHPAQTAHSARSRTAKHSSAQHRTLRYGWKLGRRCPSRHTAHSTHSTPPRLKHRTGTRHARSTGHGRRAHLEATEVIQRKNLLNHRAEAQRSAG